MDAKSPEQLFFPEQHYFDNGVHPTLYNQILPDHDFSAIPKTRGDKILFNIVGQEDAQSDNSNGNLTTEEGDGVGEAVRLEQKKRSSYSDESLPNDCKRIKKDKRISYDTWDRDECLASYIQHTSTSEPFSRSSALPLFPSETDKDEELEHPSHQIVSIGCDDYIAMTEFQSLVEMCSSRFIFPIRKTVPIGPDHQAEIPEWKSRSRIGLNYADDSALSLSCFETGKSDGDSDKWIRCVTPMPSAEILSSDLGAFQPKIECRCVNPSSIECVRQHVSEARVILKEAVGADKFGELGFWEMGDEVALRWTDEEEHLFLEVVFSNPASLGKNFWNELSLAFPARSTSELVSYYFNVFMLRKRAEQNRTEHMNIDSDDDEWPDSVDGDINVAEEADDDSHMGLLTEQEDNTSCKVSQEVDYHEESTEGDEQKDEPIFSKNWQTCSQDVDFQDDSCTSFESQYVYLPEAPNNDTENHKFYAEPCSIDLSEKMLAAFDCHFRSNCTENLNSSS